jgi:hypothetical protein
MWQVLSLSGLIFNSQHYINHKEYISEFDIHQAHAAADILSLNFNAELCESCSYEGTCAMQD